VAQQPNHANKRLLTHRRAGRVNHYAEAKGEVISQILARETTP